MKRAFAFALGPLATFVAACAEPEARVLPPYGQVLLYVDTDAPLPAPPGKKLAQTDAPPLFDRIRIEVFRPGEALPCADCTHEFDLDRELVASGRASVGITPPTDANGYVARVRLFSARFVELGQPPPSTTVDMTVALPAIAPEGVVAITVPLHTEDVGKTLGSREAPLTPQAGAPRPGFTGSWAPARRTPCRGKAGPDEVCVPGGAYWMGNPLATFQEMGAKEFSMRIVSLSPFFLDKTEVTVGAFRAAGLATATDPQPFATEPDAPGQYAPCTYAGNDVANNDALPVTCLSWQKAEAYCIAKGRDLPTEAQHQYAASALEGRLYLWGDDAPTCDDAVFARGHNFMAPNLTCPGVWVAPAGQGAKDRLDLPGGSILDLSGNVAEWALDLWNELNGPCWGSGVFHDPLCTTPSGDPSTQNLHSATGGAWSFPAFGTAASTRGRLDFASAIDPKQRDDFAPALAGMGFRCARADE
jgi:formylglycine-generating enzyme required for sulfatase activity